MLNLERLAGGSTERQGQLCQAGYQRDVAVRGFLELDGESRQWFVTIASTPIADQSYPFESL